MNLVEKLLAWFLGLSPLGEASPPVWQKQQEAPLKHTMRYTIAHANTTAEWKNAKEAYYADYALAEKDGWPLDYFKPKELASSGNGTLLINYDAANRLDKLRELMGCPLIINSAYRDRVYNDDVGGAPNSMHLEGRAFDISTDGLDKRRLYECAVACGFTGFGFYANFLHVDTGPKRWWGKRRKDFI